jgi:sensor histidine kinase YesM
MPRRAAAAFLVWSAWTALAIFFGVTTSLTYVSQGRPPIWGLALAYSLAQWWIWAALTPIVFWLSRRLPLRRGRFIPHAIAHLVLGLILAFGKVTVEGWVRWWLFGARPYLLINNLALQFFIYWAVVAAAHALDHYGRSRSRAAEIEARLGEARLQLLRAQLRPHFLFNALNAISELVHEDPDTADRMIGRLSELLRATLRTADRQTVALDDELDLVGHYLFIQQARFGDRLSIHIDVPDDCRRALVPHLILQPLVENAIQHGLAPRAAGGTIWITASAQGDTLRITVADDGVGLAAARPPEGIGHGTTRARWISIDGDAASLVLDDRPGGGTAVTMTMPFTALPADDLRPSP